MVKRLLFILSIFLFFLLNGNGKTDGQQNLLSPQTEYVTANTIIEQHPDLQHNKEINRFHDIAFATPNRSIQSTSENSERLFKVTSRQFQLFLQKGQNQLNKISEILSVTYSRHYSSLRIRSGHWVYVLRKIII